MEGFDKLLGLLEKLAEKLGTSVEQLAPHAVRHVEIKAWTAVGTGLALSVIVLLLTLAIRHALLRDAKDKYEHDCVARRSDILVARCFPVAVGAIVMTFIVSFSLSWLPNALEPTGALIKAILLP